MYREQYGKDVKPNRSTIKKMKREIVQMNPKYAAIKDEILYDSRLKNNGG